MADSKTPEPAGLPPFKPSIVHFLGFIWALHKKGVLHESAYAMVTALWNEYDALVCRHQAKCPLVPRCPDPLTCMYAAAEMPVLPGWKPAYDSLEVVLQAVHDVPRIKHVDGQD